MLEKALADIVNEDNKSENNIPSLFTINEKKSMSKPNKTAKSPKSAAHKDTSLRLERYLAPDAVHSNPTPRFRSIHSGVKKWPENAVWACVYCRLLSDDIHRYKVHLRHKHPQG